MSKRTIDVLMIDDHPLIISGYKSILSFNEMGYEINATTATSCKEAYEIITETEDLYAFDLVLLDLILPPYEEKGLYSGEDIAYLIREKFRFAKIMILTSHTEGFLLYDLKKKVNPNGLLVKSDFSADDLLEAFQKVLAGETYESKIVKEAVNEISSSDQRALLDEINREIIMLLSKGVLTKSLPSHFNLSQSTIDKRKAQIREFFLIEGGTDEDIVREAKKHGFV